MLGLPRCRAAARRGGTDDAAGNLPSLFNKGHYIIFNLTVGVLQYNYTTAHLLVWGQTQKPFIWWSG